MTRIPRAGLMALTGLAIGAAAIASAAPQSAAAPQGLSSRKTTAVTYEANRDTKVDLVGTPMMPRARGEARIQTGSRAGPDQGQGAIAGCPGAVRPGVSDVRDVGDSAARPAEEPGRSAHGCRRVGDPGHVRRAIVRARRDGRTVLRSDHTERRRGDG